VPFIQRRHAPTSPLAKGNGDTGSFDNEGIDKSESSTGTPTTSIRKSKSVSRRRKTKPKEFLGKRLLVIEDDKTQSMLLCRQLRRSGFVISAAMNGSDALRLLVPKEEIPSSVADFPSQLPILRFHAFLALKS